MNDFNEKNFHPIGNKDITELKDKSMQDLVRLKEGFEIMIAGFQRYISYHDRKGRFFEDDNFTNKTLYIEKLKLNFCNYRLQIVVNEINSRGKTPTDNSLN